jgi:hypothetical protein
LHDQLLYPFHVQYVQALQPPLDYERRRAFREWLLQQDAAYPKFLSRVLVIDKACFTRNGILNTRNQHTWADENRHSFQETRFQKQFAINVWAGIIGDFLLGPYELPPRLSGASYLQFISEQLPQLPDDVSLATRQTMWVLHDGAPAHSSRDVMRY